MSSSLTIRAEQAMLGAVLADPAAQQHVLDLVEPTDLYRPWHAQVRAAMRRVQKGGGLPGPAEVYAELRCDPDLPASVSADAVPVADLMEASPRTGHASAYAAIVVESGIRRRLELTGSRLAQAAESGDLDLVRQQAARARREFEACRARWCALPERLRRELSVLSPNDHAVATMIRHASAAGVRADRGRHGLVAESGLFPEDRDAQVHQHPAPSDDDADAQKHEQRCRSPSGRSQAAVAEAVGAQALRDLTAGPFQIAHVRRWLRQENFALRSDGVLYALMCDMDAAGMAVDPVTISWQAARRGLRVEPDWLAGGNVAFAVPSAREVHRHGLLAEAAQTGRDIQIGTADQRYALHGLFQSASERLPALEGRQQAVRADRQAQIPGVGRPQPVSTRSRRPGREAAS
jgi:DnaB-like helicase N terminal domain